MSRYGRRVGGLVLAVIVAVLPPASAQTDLEDELADVLNQIDELEGQLTEAAADRSGIVGAILTTRDRLASAQAELDSAEADLREVRVSLADNAARLSGARDQLAASHAAIAETRRRIESNRGDAQSWVRQQYMRRAESESATMMLATRRVSDLGRLAYLMEIVSTRTTASIDRHEALRAEEERQQARIAEREAALEIMVATLEVEEAKRVELASVAAELTAAVRTELRAQRELLAELDSLVEHFETELDGLEAEQNRIEKLIGGAASGGGTSPSVLVRPVPGPITSPFGPRLHPILGYTRMHTGVDMTAPQGEDIRAAGAGLVILADSYGGYGITVVIDHGGGMTTLYAHQSRLLVGRGDEVAAGEVIGEAGSSGLATGAHLHFEVRLDGTPVDPADYL